MSERKREPLPTAIGQTVQEVINKMSVSDEPAESKQEMSLEEEVQKVRDAFPDKYDGYRLQEASKCRNPLKYGIRRVREIDALLKSPQKRPKTRHGYVVKTLSWRCTETVKDRLQIEFELLNWGSFQNGLDNIVLPWLEARHERNV